MRRAAVLLALFAACAAGAAAQAPQPTQVARIEVGRAPCGAAVVAGGLWVGVDGAGTLVRVDIRTRRVTRRVQVGRTACYVTAGYGAVWVTRYGAGEIVRLDARTGRVRRARVGSEPFDVLAAYGSVWTAQFGDGTVARISPTTGRVVRRVRVGGSPAGLAACRGRIWVGGGRTDTWISSLDPKSLRVERVDVGAEAPAWPRCIRGELWATTSEGVARVGPATGVVLAEVAIAGTTATAAGGPDGLVWVTDKEGWRIVRIDPASNQVVDELPAGAGAFHLEPVAGEMWVTSYAGSDVRVFRGSHKQRVSD